MKFKHLLLGLAFFTAIPLSYSQKINQVIEGHFTRVIKIGSDGAIYESGTFSREVDFDPTESEMKVTAIGKSVSFIRKLNPEGNIIWVRQLESDNSNMVWDMEVNQHGDVFCTGSFAGTTDFDPGQGVQKNTSAGWPEYTNNDIFVLKLNTNGDYQWHKTIGSNNRDHGEHIELTPTGDVVVAGEFRGRMFFNPPRSHQLSTPTINTSWADAFLLKYDTNGNFIWVKKFGAGYHDRIAGFKIDRLGNYHIAGHYSDKADMDPGPGYRSMSSPDGKATTFAMTLDPNANLIWIKKFTEGKMFSNLMVDVNSKNEMIIAGSFQGEHDVLTGPAKRILKAQSSDAFLIRLDLKGNTLHAKHFSGTGFDAFSAMAIDNEDNIYITGRHAGRVDFQGTQLSSVGNSDAIILMTDGKGNRKYLRSINSPGSSLDIKTMVMRNNELIFNVTGGRADYDIDFSDEVKVVEKNKTHMVFMQKPEPEVIVEATPPPAPEATGCTNPVKQAEIEGLKLKAELGMRKGNTVGLVKEATEGRCMTTGQIIEVINYIKPEPNKNKLAKYFYTIVSDKENYDNVVNAITTNPGKQKIINKQIGR